MFDYITWELKREFTRVNYKAILISEVTQAILTRDVKHEILNRNASSNITIRMSDYIT